MTADNAATLELLKCHGTGILAEPFDRVTTDRIRALVAELPVSKNLLNAELKADVDDDVAGAIESRRVRLQVRWKNHAGEWDAPVAVTSWISRRRAKP